MPVYSYQCNCGKKFDKLFLLMSKAARHIDSTKCACGQKADRIFENPATFFLVGDADKPRYSDPSNPNK